MKLSKNKIILNCREAGPMRILSVNQKYFVIIFDKRHIITYLTVLFFVKPAKGYMYYVKDN